MHSPTSVISLHTESTEPDSPHLPHSALESISNRINDTFPVLQYMDNLLPELPNSSEKYYTASENIFPSQMSSQNIFELSPTASNLVSQRKLNGVLTRVLQKEKIAGSCKKDGLQSILDNWGIPFHYKSTKSDIYCSIYEIVTAVNNGGDSGFGPEVDEKIKADLARRGSNCNSFNQSVLKGAKTAPYIRIPNGSFVHNTSHQQLEAAQSADVETAKKRSKTAVEPSFTKSTKGEIFIHSDLFDPANWTSANLVVPTPQQYSDQWMSCNDRDSAICRASCFSPSSYYRHVFKAALKLLKSDRERHRLTNRAIVPSAQLTRNLEAGLVSVLRGHAAVTLVTFPNPLLGVDFATVDFGGDGMCAGSSVGLYVQGIEPELLTAEARAVLKCGDRLVSIEMEAVELWPVEEQMEAVRSPSRPICLGFVPGLKRL